MSARPFAVFDIDGTLIRWQLYHAMADALVKFGIISKDDYQSIITMRMSWKKRHSPNSFSDYENVLIRLIRRALTGLEYETFANICTAVVERYQDQVYVYTRDTLNRLQEQGYLTFAISTSPSELVGQVASYYNFDDFSGSRYLIKEGRLSGKTQLLLKSGKQHQLAALIKRHGAVEKGSIGIGDTAIDIGMLEMVERPIAFNPARKLFEHANKHGWDIVVERKNVVYQLKYSHGQYLLSPTDGGQTSIF
ncbi:HAD family phosphatase [Patescibacteria group bacterium]|nr:HAD family phosphatase [Patescibacteria group bacterium]